VVRTPAKVLTLGTGSRQLVHGISKISLFIYFRTTPYDSFQQADTAPRIGHTDRVLGCLMELVACYFQELQVPHLFPDRNATALPAFCTTQPALKLRKIILAMRSRRREQ